jgi:hypothetical protein
MKKIARILYLLSLAWVVVVGVHSSLCALRPLLHDPLWLRWFAKLPLPPVLGEMPWSLLVGVAGALTACGLASSAAQREKQRRERSEA